MRRALRVAAVGVGVVALAGCGGDTRATGAVALNRYMGEIEPLRLGVNRLLEGADPIIAAFRDHRLGAAAAAAHMEALERKFASYTVEVSAIRPRSPALRSLHAEYAGTYVLEDAYLSALVSGLRQQDFSELPNTQSAQRAAIIRWRTGLMVLAREEHVALPADLQQAGRGEIAPSPAGS
jgi:hypothetical protein